MSLTLLLMVLFALYRYAREPSTWRWIEKDSEAQAEKSAASKPAPKINGWTERLGDGPAQSAPGELEEFRHQLQAVTDKAALVESEMPAYWRLMRWALAEPLAALEKRALNKVIFTQLYEDPDRYRGRLVRLRLHIIRILDYEAPQNGAGVKNAYEIWAWTDDSLSYPYVVVVPEIPPWFKTGDKIREEAVFVGYFLKTMKYDAFNKVRYAPLLIGRLRPLSGKSDSTPRKIAAGGPDEYIWGSVLIVVVGGVLWYCRPVKRAQPSLVLSSPQAAEADFGAWLGESTGAGPTHAGAKVVPDVVIEPAPPSTNPEPSSPAQSNDSTNAGPPPSAPEPDSSGPNAH